MGERDNIRVANYEDEWVMFPSQMTSFEELSNVLNSSFNLLDDWAFAIRFWMVLAS